MIYSTHVTEAAKILVLPTPVWSHMRVGAIVGRTLVEDGHEVWILAPKDKQASLEQQGLHVLPATFSYLPTFDDQLKDGIMDNLFGSNETRGAIMTFSKSAYKKANYIMSMEVLQNEAIMNEIATVQFDLAVMGCIFVFRSFYLIPYKYNIPYITWTVIDTPSLAGVTGFPSFQPGAMLSPPVTSQMTFSERLRNTVTLLLFYIGTEYLDSGLDFQEKFAPEMPSRRPSELMSDSLMWLVAANDLCLDYPRMSAPNYRFIGTFSPEPARELTGDLRKYADGATKGLILITFGTSGIGSAIIDRYLSLILEVSGQLEQRVILHRNTKDIPGNLPKNVRIESWVPQNDLLGHPSTVLMVQHGGVNGQAEATYHGVPQICLGFQEEQRYNCHRLQYHHYGIALQLRELSATRLLQAIRDVISDPSYRSNVTRCARIMRSMPQPRDELRFWVNHILEFGGAHLRPSSLDMPFYSLYMLDIMVIFAAILAFVLLIMAVCVRCVCRTVCSHGKQKKAWAIDQHSFVGKVCASARFVLVVLSNKNNRIYKSRKLVLWQGDSKVCIN